jgi:predicted phage terminase large subunit-like protein
MQESEIDPLHMAVANSFYAFAQTAFINLYPGVPFVDNWSIDCMCEYLTAVEAGEIRRLIINCPPRSLKSFLVARAYPAWIFGRTPHEKFITASYGYEISEQNARDCRMILKSDWYKKVFPKTIISPSMDRSTHFETTARGQYYAATSLSPIVGLGANTIIMDDPLKPMEALSDTIRNSTNLNIRSTFFTRFDNQNTGKMVLVMQRLHEDDPTGNLMRDGGYTLLKLPAETKTQIYIDLKTFHGNFHWEYPENGLLFESRLGRDVLDRMRVDMLEAQYCTPAESPVLMGDLSTKKISEIVAGEKILGFTSGHWKSGMRVEMRRLIPSTVQRIMCRNSDVVKITLDSGRSIRCTENHEWFTGRGNRSVIEKNRKLYLPAKVGRKLCRVSEPFLRELKTEEEFRLAGWLAGFFDGEGSAVIRKRNKNKGCLINFSQGAGHNLPLCEKLEYALRYFGFEYKYNESIRDDRKHKKESAHMSRLYYLTGNSLENMRKMLYLIKVTKWRDRIMQGAYISQFIRGEEKVISIEPDGYEPVYSLTTETGNYIVWGFASSNCGQMLQSPVPLGGGEFREEYVKYYTNGSIRPKDMNIVILCDPAGGEELNKKKKKMTDWTAFIVIGLASDNNYYVLDIIRDRFNPTERVEMLFTLHRRWNMLSGKPPKVGYEKYGMMTDTHYIREKMKQDSYNFSVIELGGKMIKEERIRRLIPIMQDNRLYFPEKLLYSDNEGRQFDLVQEIIKSEMLTFPKSRFDDCLDAMSRIVEEDLFMTFPMPKLSALEKSFMIKDPEDQPWVDF